MNVLQSDVIRVVVFLFGFEEFYFLLDDGSLYTEHIKFLYFFKLKTNKIVDKLDFKWNEKKNFAQLIFE